MGKITEKSVSQKLLKTAYVLVTQQEQQGNGTFVESLRRVPLSVFYSEIAVKVTVTQESDGNYTADRYCAELLEAHNAGSVVYCQWGSRVLPLLVASKAFCAFGCVYSGNIYTVTVGITSVTVTATALPSGGVNITDDGNGNVTIG